MELPNIFYDLAVAWNWIYDIDFIKIIEKNSIEKNIKFLQITPQNIEEVFNLLNESKLYYKVFFDRASDTDKNFNKLFEIGKKLNIYMINSYEKVCFATDKATMHLEFISSGIETPYTIILPPYNQDPSFPEINLSLIGPQFIAKPARGGGGEGVFALLNDLSKIQQIRKSFPDDKYLLQSYIKPFFINSKPAWFRVIFCFNELFLCWWNPETHIYEEVKPEEEIKFGLNKLREITLKIAEVCKLEIFSTEIALTSDNKFIVVDYVNDQIDLRIKSLHSDGVPDNIVHKIAEKIVEFAYNFR